MANWILVELENDIFLVIGFFKKNICFCFFPMKISLAFIWGFLYFCTMDGFFRILEKTSSELICTRLYHILSKTFLLTDYNILLWWISLKSFKCLLGRLWALRDILYCQPEENIKYNFLSLFMFLSLCFNAVNNIY